MTTSTPPEPGPGHRLMTYRTSSGPYTYKMLARRDHARTQGWLGEIDGIDLTLRFLAGKRAETLRLARFSHDTVTSIGMPAIGAPS
jgi:hypothetical protein